VAISQKVAPVSSVGRSQKHRRPALVGSGQDSSPCRRSYYRYPTRPPPHSDFPRADNGRDWPPSFFSVLARASQSPPPTNTKNHQKPPWVLSLPPPLYGPDEAPFQEIRGVFLGAPTLLQSYGSPPPSQVFSRTSLFPEFPWSCLFPSDRDPQAYDALDSSGTIVGG